jgi:hypothetical protein
MERGSEVRFCGASIMLKTFVWESEVGSYDVEFYVKSVTADTAYGADIRIFEEGTDREVSLCSKELIKVQVRCDEIASECAYEAYVEYMEGIDARRVDWLIKEWA